MKKLTVSRALYTWCSVCSALVEVINNRKPNDVRMQYACCNSPGPTEVFQILWGLKKK